MEAKLGADSSREQLSGPGIHLPVNFAGPGIRAHPIRHVPHGGKCLLVGREGRDQVELSLARFGRSRIGGNLLDSSEWAWDPVSEIDQ